MNRLTRVEGLSTLIKDGWKKKDTEKNYTSICYGCEEIRKCVNKCGFCKALDKLAAYEDTGLEPEQIDELNKMLLNDQIRHGRALDKLLEYQKLEKQGLLIKLPCKVGDTVYLIHEVARCTPTIEPVKFGIALYNYFGKTVFLTQAEAEKALEGGRKWKK